MSTEKRAPLLSDDEIRDTFMYGSLIRDREHGFKSGAGYVRKFYEDLITRGELRAVNTVEVWHPSVPEDVWREWLNGTAAEFSMLVTKCCSRNPWCPPWGLGKGVWDEEEFVVKYERLMYVCPGCGNPIAP
jgi:hypothetical protein